jgi:acetylornithine deacetylase/succinyl-diaminopimelate desuccinylase-like protein
MDAALTEATLNLAIKIQQIPAPTFHEDSRARFVYDRFAAEGLSTVSIDPHGNVFGCIRGSGGGKPLVVSAHLDTVFPETTDLSITRTEDRIIGPGIGDNSVGLAGLFGLLWLLRRRPTALPGDVWLVANVCEEGLGDLRGMRAVVDRFGSQPMAYIVLEGMALGQVYNRGLGVRRFQISIETPGGHSWVDYGSPSAIHELLTLASSITQLQLPDQPRTTLNIGKIAGGVSVNTIAPEAHLELDLRSENPQVLEHIAAQVESLAAGAQRTGVRIAVKLIGSRPAGEIPSEDRLVRLACKCVEQVSLQPRLNIGSTDANIPLSRGLPAICVGLTVGAGAHTLQEYIYIRPLSLGLTQLASLVEQLFL